MKHNGTQAIDTQRRRRRSLYGDCGDMLRSWASSPNGQGAYRNRYIHFKKKGCHYQNGISQYRDPEFL